MSSGRGRPVVFIGFSGGFLEYFFRLPTNSGGRRLVPASGSDSFGATFSGVGVLVVTLGPLSGVTPLMSRLSTVTHLSRANES